MKKKYIFGILSLILISILFYLYTHNTKQKFEFVKNHVYEYEFAVMNKSFKRDLERSVILYKSFEKYFINAENIPFFIIIPVKDWQLFLDRFSTLKLNNEIKKIPHFMTEQEVFQRCGDEDISEDGIRAQQVVKLCFGSTKLARNYLMMDSDNYFLRKFNYKILFDNYMPKTTAWKLPNSVIQNNKKLYQGYGVSPILRNQEKMTVYDMRMFMKEFFGNKYSDHYGFVMSPFLFNSDALFRMKDFIKEKGGYKFSHLIKLIGFEMQWYGEYIQQYENFIPMNCIFELIGSPDECRSENPSQDSYGFCFQSIIYEKDSMRDNPKLVYKRPEHCPVEIPQH